MNIEQLTAAAKAAHDAKEANKRGYKFATHEATTADGKTVSCTIETTAGRRGGWKTTTRYKLEGKVISRAALDAILIGRSPRWHETINPELRSAFEQQAPALADALRDYLLRVWEAISARHPEGVPAYPEANSRDWSIMRETLRDVYDVVKHPALPPSAYDRHAKAALSETKLAAYCKRYGMDAAVQWFYKTNAKLGELTDAEVLHDSGGDMIVVGKRHGKEVRIEQQRIINVSKKGNAYHQWPSRIYINGQFIPDADYQKAMLLADLAA